MRDFNCKDKVNYTGKVSFFRIKKDKIFQKKLLKIFAVMALYEENLDKLESNLKKKLHISSQQQQVSCAKDLTRQTIFSSGNKLCASKSFRIIHFNDIYDIEGDEKEKSGGAARFSTAIKLLQEEGPCLVFFSGDAFAPSTCK